MFETLFIVVLYGLTIICFWLPYKNGNQLTGKLVGLLFSVIITVTLILNLEFLEIFIWVIIIIFQFLFITYWTFIRIRRRKAGKITVTILSVGFLLLIMQPWIADWTYSKKDVRRVLSFHQIKLHNDFEIMQNESGGVRDFYETFTIRISPGDFNRISEKIKTSANYKGLFTDYLNLPSANFNKHDTVDFETEDLIEREYFSNQKMNNGTYHFRIQLDKTNSELSYTGSDE